MQRISCRWSAAENLAVNKSLLAIAGLGLGGCVLLSVLMKQVVAIDAEQRQLPFLPALQARFGAQLDGALRVKEESTDGATRWLVNARVRDGVDAVRLAPAIGAELWLHAGRAGSAASEARIVLRCEDGSPAVSLVVPRPGPGRAASVPPLPPR